MTLAAFQQALCQLIASPELCVDARADAAHFLSQFDLTERERGRLQDIVRQRGMSLNCTLYRSNRITPLYTLLHSTCVVLGDELKDHLDAYWRDAELRDLEFEQEIHRFARFLRPRTSDPLVLEVLDFELALNELRFAPRRRILSEMNGGHDPGYVVHPLVRVVRFEHDPHEVLDALARGEIARNLPRSEFFLVLSAIDAELRAIELSPPDARVLWQMQDEDAPRARADVERLIALGVVCRRPLRSAHPTAVSPSAGGQRPLQPSA
jgi:hypothetical protein